LIKVLKKMKIGKVSGQPAYSSIKCRRNTLILRVCQDSKQHRRNVIPKGQIVGFLTSVVEGPRAPLEMKLTAILAVACLLVAAAYAVDPRMINARRADPYTIQDPGSLPTPHHLSSMLLLHCA
jgi:hypothetical protein